MDNCKLKPGDKVKCIVMHNDPRPVKSGKTGRVQMIDDIGTIHVVWEDGRLLGLVPGVDEFDKV